MIWLKQCSFKQGTSETVAWIDESAAHVGYKMTFEDADEDEAMKGIWEVTHVGDARMTEKTAKMRERTYLNHRKTTDI